MKVLSVSASQKNRNFGAKIKFVQNGAKNLISKPSMEILTQKAENIGKNTDIITIYLSQKVSDKYASLQEDSFRYYTNITGEFGNDSPMCYPYFAEIGDVYGDINNRQNKAFILAEHFIDRINKALKS